MKNYLRKRQFDTTDELIDLIHDYFEEEDFIMIETLYKYLGIYKHNYRDGATRSNKTHNLGAKIIDEAKQEIHAHLTRVTAYGQTEKELEATKVIKSEDLENQKTTWEFNRADPKVLRAYLNSRYKDNGDGETEVKEKVTINIGNKGPNALLGEKDA